MNKYDIKIFELIEMLKASGKIKFDTDFCNDVGVLKQNLTRIKNGLAHFTPDHFEKICKSYNVNANWIFGIEKKTFNMKPAQRLKAIQYK